MACSCCLVLLFTQICFAIGLAIGFAIGLIQHPCQRAWLGLAWLGLGGSWGGGRGGAWGHELGWGARGQARPDPAWFPPVSPGLGGSGSSGVRGGGGPSPLG